MALDKYKALKYDYEETKAVKMCFRSLAKSCLNYALT